MGGRRKSGRVQIWFGKPAKKFFKEEADLNATTYFTISYVCLFAASSHHSNPTKQQSLYTLFQ